MKTDKKTDTVCYLIGWCLIGIIILYYILSESTGIGFLHFHYPCLFHAWTGYYCPGCGGTRAVYALLQGKFFRSFVYHPLVPCTAVLGGWFMVSQTLERLSRRKWRIGMHFRDWYLWAALVLITVNFIVKNMALAIWHIDLLC